MAEITTGCLTCFQQPGLDFLTVQSVENTLIDEALRKHFWFTDAELEIATVCLSCWNQVINFHQFYVSVEKLYHSRMASVIVKSELDGFDCLEEIQQVGAFNVKAEASVGRPENDTRTTYDRGCRNVGLQQKFNKYTAAVSLGSARELHNIPELEPTGQLENYTVLVDDDTFAKQNEGSPNYRVDKALPVGKVRMYQDLRMVLSDCMVKDPPEICSASSSHETEQFESTTPKTDGDRVSNHSIIKPNKNCRNEDGCIERMNRKKNCVEEGILNCPNNNSDAEHGCNRPMTAIIKSEPEETAVSSIILEPTEQITAQTEDQSDDMQCFALQRKGGRMKSRTENQEDDNYIRTHVRYICEHCGHDSPTFSAFKRHSKLKHSIREPALMCCGTKYFRKHYLLQHVQVLNQPDKFRCEKCEKNFIYKERYVHHMRSVHAAVKPMLKCRRCPRTYTTKVQLIKHRKDHASSEFKKRICTNCKKRFAHKQRYDAHIIKCWSGSGNCGICNLVFPSQVSLETHNFQIHGPIGQQIPKTTQTLEGAEKLHLPEELVARSSNIAYVETSALGTTTEVKKDKTAETVVASCKEECDSMPSDDEDDPDDFDSDNPNAPRLCNRRRRQEDDECISKHIKLFCKQCGRGNLTFSKLQKHAQLTHGDLAPFVLCCGKKFEKKYRLLAHVKLVNNPEAFRCEPCDRNYTGLDGLQRHQKEVHMIHRFKCDQCPKTFPTSALLRNHMQNPLDHDTDSLKCTGCLKLYECRKALTRHINRKHPEFPKFNCNLCPKAFRLEVLFVQHKLKHKRLQCPSCTLLLRTRGSLRNHVRMVHPDAHTCMTCIQVFPIAAALQTHKIQEHSTKMKTHQIREMDDHDCEGDDLSEWSVGTKNEVESNESVSVKEETPNDLISLIVKSEPEVGGNECLEEEQQDFS